MVAERVSRSRAVEYKIFFIQKKREVYVYLGNIWVGRIISSENDPLHKQGGFGVYLQLPSMWGPVARAPNVSEAKIEASLAIRRWLSNMVEFPTDPEERPEKPTIMRMTRTRNTLVPTPTRIARTRR